MVLHRHIGVRASNVCKTTTARELRSIHQKLKVHHVVGDDEKVLLIGNSSPTADEPQIVVEALRKRLGGRHEQFIVLLRVQQSLGVAV